MLIIEYFIFVLFKQSIFSEEIRIVIKKVGVDRYNIFVLTPQCTSVYICEPEMRKSKTFVKIQSIYVLSYVILLYESHNMPYKNKYTSGMHIRIHSL